MLRDELKEQIAFDFSLIIGGCELPKDKKLLRASELPDVAPAPVRGSMALAEPKCTV